MRGLDMLIEGVAGMNRATAILCKWMTIILVGMIAVDIFFGVFFRYVLSNALSWYEESAQYLMVWLVFAASPLVLRQGGKISLGLVIERFPQRMRMFGYLLIYAFVCLFLCALAYQGFGLSWMARRQQLTSVPVSFAFVYGAVPFGAAVMALVSFEIALRALRGIFVPDKAQLFQPDPLNELPVGE